MSDITPVARPTQLNQQWTQSDLDLAAARGDWALIEAARAAGQLAHLLNNPTPEGNQR